MPEDEPRLSARIIRAAYANPLIVVVASVLLGCAGLFALRETAIDAFPDLGDVQVIVHTSFPGQAPRIVEDHVTFPLTTALRAVPGATVVRGYSSFGDSFVYVLFRDGTDPYWARTRVMEYLSQVQAQLPPGAHASLGPDATAAGWIYEYALVDRTGHYDIAGLRSLQDWWLRFELQSVPGVAQVAPIGGMVKEYQVIVDPDKAHAYGISLRQIRDALSDGTDAVGGSVVELAEAEYIVHADSYVRRLDDLKAIGLRTGTHGSAITVGDVAEVRIGPQARRGIADLDGRGEVVGAAVILQRGANPQRTLEGVKERLAVLARSLPAGVEIIPTYDRSSLTRRAIDKLSWTLLEEGVAVLLVCLLFLQHARSAAVILVFLLLGVLCSFLIMWRQGIEANIMSLAGIAIAIGTMVDAAVVMIENAHKRLEQADCADRRRVVLSACLEVGPVLVVSLLIIALSFLPVLSLEAQEGRLFAPLAYTKIYAMLAGALLSITLVPVCMQWLLRGRVQAELNNGVNRALAAAYRPALELTVRHPWLVCGAALFIVLVSAWPLSRIGFEFMPAMDEGDLLYMPVTAPGISAESARVLLQRTDALIMQIPEVERVFGKVGRADTATDPAPLEMFETMVKLKPRSQWRSGMTAEAVKAQLEAAVQLPGVSNAWLQPIRARVDMLSSGVRTPLGLKISGPDPQELQRLAMRIQAMLGSVPGGGNVYAERPVSGRYIDVDVDRVAAARLGVSLAEIHEVIEYGIGGRVVAENIEGRERYPINVRYPASERGSVDELRRLPLWTSQGSRIMLGDVARLRIVPGPAVLRSEDGVPVVWVYVGSLQRSVDEFVRAAQMRIDAGHVLPPGYTLRWSGQYEYLKRAFGRLEVMIPVILTIIVLLLLMSFRRWADVLLVLGSLPVALVGAIWLLWLLGYLLSVAVAVGLISLAGIAVETGILMMLYLNDAWRARCAAVALPTQADLLEAIMEGALRRLRPKLMTVTTILAGLLPMLMASGTGSEVMRRLAAPMVGGVCSAAILTLLVMPALFLLVHRRELP